MESLFPVLVLGIACGLWALLLIRGGERFGTCQACDGDGCRQDCDRSGETESVTPS